MVDIKSHVIEITKEVSGKKMKTRDSSPSFQNQKETAKEIEEQPVR